jgi:putative membrane protein insertion efficiency factor
MQKSEIEIREPRGEQSAEETEARVGADTSARPSRVGTAALGPRRLALALLQLYKRWISPAFPPSCRYVPTCSEYATEAIERYGVFRGGLMATWRLLRCHPLAKGGLDPVVAKTLSSHREHHPTLSSRPKQIIAKAMICAAEGPCVSPRLYLDINHSTKEMTSN